MMELLLTKQAQDDLDAIEKKHRDKILAKLLPKMDTGGQEAAGSNPVAPTINNNK